MHPSVITTGIGSLFRPKSKTENPQHDGAAGQSNTAQTLSDTLASTGLNGSSVSPFNLPTNDPNYDPAFPNDIRLAQRSQLDGAIHFFTKYSDRLAQATRQYVTSHVEFGSCLADYPGLKRRYRAIRELEDIDDCTQSRGPDGRFLRRVRFANYYTASTGRSKPTPPVRDPKETSHISDGRTSQDQSYHQENRPNASEISQISTNKSDKDTLKSEPTDSQNYKSCDDTTSSEFALEATPDTLLEIPPFESGQGGLASHPDGILPPVPPVPDVIPAFDPSPYTTKAEQKKAQKEHSRMVKSYERARKDRDKVIRSREKAVSKLEKATAKERRQQAQEQNRDTSSEQQSLEESDPHINSELVGGAASERSIQPTAPKKDKKFCSLPPKDANGDRDPLWIRIHMKGMDEVVAHQSLFFPSEAYERLVGDVSAQIEQWVNDDATTRMIITEMEDVKA